MLADWIENHPFKNQPEAPLWVKLGSRSKYEPLDYYSARAIVLRALRKAGLKKRVYSYLFRHTRSTKLAKILTEAQICEFCGWVQGSDMPRVYIHLSGRDVDNTLLQAYGIKVDKDKKIEALKLLECSRCKQKNAPINKYCSRCGFPISKEAQIEVLEMKKEGENLVNELIKRLEKLEETVNSLRSTIK